MRTAGPFREPLRRKTTAQQINEIMTADPTTVTPQTPIVEVARLMREEDIGEVLIAEGDRLRGLPVPDGDVLVGVAGLGDMPVGAVPVDPAACDDPLQQPVHRRRAAAPGERWRPVPPGRGGGLRGPDRVRGRKRMSHVPSRPAWPLASMEWRGSFMAQRACCGVGPVAPRRRFTA
ncbi:CBS domain-containing protein [Streptomyces sp. URMC 125]|uniref:CBS domain-containing protein n=1 Tax=Streptomyces sp. URMC 125 TaxID=3423419 RepID=UPI003F1E1DBA